MPGGRPARIRSPENAELICARLVDGLTLREIGRELECDASAIAHWIAEDEAFAQRYARAKEQQAELMSGELLEICDDGSNDWMERTGAEGETVRLVDHEHIQRSRLRVDTRKWLMSKMLPKVYGERVTQELTGKDGKDLIPPEQSAERTLLALLNLLEGARKDKGEE